MSDLEERIRVGVIVIADTAPDDLIELRSEVLVHQPPAQHIGTRHARIHNARQHRHRPARLEPGRDTNLNQPCSRQADASQHG